ncbi:MAG: response regulator [Ginsengibacter sp.]
MKKVLLIEDDINTIELVKHILATYGFTVYTHLTGLKVDEVVKVCQPDLILLDVRLPGKPGTQVCKELKQTSNIPIILFSAEADEKQLVNQCNADAFLGKPFDINELIISISLHAN